MISVLQQGKTLDVVEIYSVPPVIEEAMKFGMKTSEAMDIRTGWNFDGQKAKEIGL